MKIWFFQLSELVLCPTIKAKCKDVSYFSGGLLFRAYKILNYVKSETRNCKLKRVFRS